jgi:hypothetical protein
MTIGEVLAIIQAKVAARSGAPVVHENGFIQLPLSDRIRLHVWPDGPIVKQATDSPIHDHRFAFESYVLRGMLTHIEYEWWQDQTKPTHRLHVVKPPKPGLTPTDETGFLKIHSQYRLGADSAYTFGARRFHQSIGHGLTATVMVKTKNYPEYDPRVLCPIGQVPDNDFNRATSNDPALLWGYIERAVQS